MYYILHLETSPFTLITEGIKNVSRLLFWQLQYILSLQHFLWDISSGSEKGPCNSVLYHMSCDVTFVTYSYSMTHQTVAISELYIQSHLHPKHICPKWLLTELTHESVFSNNVMINTYFQLGQVENTVYWIDLQSSWPQSDISTLFHRIRDFLGLKYVC